MDLQYSHYARTGDPGSGSGATAQANSYNGLDQRVMVTTSDPGSGPGQATSNARGFVYDMDHRLIGVGLRCRKSPTGLR